MESSALKVPGLIVLVVLAVVALALAASQLFNGTLAVENSCPKLSQAGLDLDTSECPTTLGSTLAEARTSWEIEKTAVTTSPIVNPNNTPIDYQVKVTEGPTKNILVATGQILITNDGEQTPTLSSVVVNLQDATKKPFTIATAVAVKDPACDDGQGVEGAQTCFGVFGNTPEASITIRDINGNDVTALLETVPIPPITDPKFPCASAVVLNYKVEFDLDQTGLSPGDRAHIDILTTFVGAGGRGKSKSKASCSVDANCNGSIDQDNPQTCELNESEDNNVRTIKQRSSLVVPALVPVCPSVVKNDPGATSLDPLCVQASTNGLQKTINQQSEGAMDVEQVSGTASCVADNCSTDITNTATLTCLDGRNELIQGSPAGAAIQATCTEEGEPPGEISVGDFCTATQVCWGQLGPGGFCASTRNNQFGLLVSAFESAFGIPSFGGILIGDIFGGLNGPPAFAARWTSGPAVSSYLPNSTPAGTLTADLNNPIATSSGVLDAQLLTTTFNMARDDAGLFAKNSLVRLGDLIVQDCTPAFQIAGSLQGLTVEQLICVADEAVSGTAGCFGPSIPSCVVTVGPPSCGLLSNVSASLSQINEALDAVNNNFDNCTQNLGCLALPPP
ncbi:hypothetical protein IH979_03070 [Patescibacteria group bacterium]|nr:hypothetical protein [Patescibacteria group bacterium]